MSLPVSQAYSSSKLWKPPICWTGRHQSISRRELSVNSTWMEEPGGLQSMGLLRVWHDWATDFTFTFYFHALEKEMATTQSGILALRIPGTGEPSGLPSLGSHRVGHDWSDLAAAAAMLITRIMFQITTMALRRRSEMSGTNKTIDYIIHQAFT